MTKYALFLVSLIAFLAPMVGVGGLIGEPAPKLAVSEWIKGGPVEAPAGTNLVVVEIWRTTGAPSRAAITNLNNLQTRFKNNGVVVVGISDEPEETLKAFMLGEGTNIEYAVAADQKRQTSMAYMKSAEQVAVPYAFVVGTNGVVRWHGHPLHGLDRALEQIIAGQFDDERAKKLEVANHQMVQYLTLARRNDPRAGLAGSLMAHARTNDLELQCDMVFQIATDRGIAKRDFPLAYAIMADAETHAPTNNPRLAITRAVLLFESGKRNDGLTLATQAVAWAQSPEEKSSVETLLQTMEIRWAAIQSRQSKTNSPAAPDAAGGVPAANTNQPSIRQTVPEPKSTGKQ